MGVRVPQHSWRSENFLWKSVLFFHQVGSEHWIQVVRFGGRHLCLWRYPATTTINATSETGSLTKLTDSVRWLRCFSCLHLFGSGITGVHPDFLCGFWGVLVFVWQTCH